MPERFHFKESKEPGLLLDKRDCEILFQEFKNHTCLKENKKEFHSIVRLIEELLEDEEEKND